MSSSTRVRLWSNFSNLYRWAPRTSRALNYKVSSGRGPPPLFPAWVLPDGPRRNLKRLARTVGVECAHTLAAISLRIANTPHTCVYKYKSGRVKLTFESQLAERRKKKRPHKILSILARICARLACSDSACVNFFGFAQPAAPPY